MPKLSIITVCRNEEADIVKTAESIVHQTWQDYEWIVIDGASSDGTLAKLEPYAGRIGRLLSEPDSGIYNAMNKGIRLAQGEYLIFMNGGDAFHHPEVLEEVFSKNPDGDILYGDVSITTREKIITRKMPRRIISPLYFINSIIPHQSSFIKRKLFDQYGLYDESLRIASDCKHWIIFSLNSCKFQYLNKIISIMNGGGISLRRNDISSSEITSVISTYFHAGCQQFSSRVSNISEYRLFKMLPLLKIKERAGKTSYLLFGCIPVLYKFQNSL